MRDVEVIITRETLPVTRTGFGLPLIVTTESVKAYTKYGTLADVAVDHASGTKAYKAAAALLVQTPRPSQIAIVGLGPDADEAQEITAALDALVLEHDDWYFLLCTEQTDAVIGALASWVETRPKIYAAATSSLTLAATLTGDRTIIMHHTAPAMYPEAAWIGRCAPEDPGAITWKFKSLVGVAPVSITTTQLAQLHEDGGNTYVTKMGRGQTSEGLVTSGEYIDTIRSQDWLSTRIAENVQSLLSKAPKVPYDARGIAQVVSCLQDSLQQATAQGIIARDADDNPLWSVTAPDRESIPADDRARRILPDVKFEATLAGAIHGVRIRGTLRV